MPVSFRSLDGLPWGILRQLLQRSFTGWVGGLLLSVSLFGCGAGGEVKETGTVSGTVVLDGKPVTKGLVSFSMAAEGAGALADLDANGGFKFEGPLQVGEYVVTVGPPRQDPNSGPKTFIKIDPKDYASIPKKYYSETTSDLKAHVIEGENKIELELKP